MTKDEVERLTNDNRRLEAKVRDLEARLHKDPKPQAPQANGERRQQVGSINVDHVEREAVIAHSTETRSFDTSGCRGRIVYVLLKDLGNKPSGEGELADAMREHGWNYPHQTMAPELAKMKKGGDLVSDEGRPAKYRLPGLVKVKVVEAMAAR